MKLFSVCPACEFKPQPYDGSRAWGDFDKCPSCGIVMDVWTESGVENECNRLRMSQNIDGGDSVTQADINDWREAAHNQSDGDEQRKHQNTLCSLDPQPKLRPGPSDPSPAPGGDVREFFGENVDRWGALEWFDRMAKAIHGQDAAVLAGDEGRIEICRNVAASSAMRIVREFEKEVRAALTAGEKAGAVADQEAMRAEIDRLNRILNTPTIEPFIEAAVSEAKHQIYRWGEQHDATKTAWDWYWLAGYLTSKAAHAALAKDWDKAKHHTITAAAMLANWHRHICDADAILSTGARRS